MDIRCKRTLDWLVAASLIGLLSASLAGAQASEHRHCRDDTGVVSREEVARLLDSGVQPWQFYGGPVAELTSRSFFSYSAMLGFHEHLRRWAADRRNIAQMEQDTLVATAAFGDLESLRILIAAGVNADQSDDEGSTALMIAISCGYRSIYEYLVAEAKADVQRENARGQDAMMFAIMAQDPTAVRLLLRSGFDVSKSRSRGASKTPLDLAETVGNSEILKLIRQASAKKPD